MINGLALLRLLSSILFTLHLLTIMLFIWDKIWISLHFYSTHMKLICSYKNITRQPNWDWFDPNHHFLGSNWNPVWLFLCVHSLINSRLWKKSRILSNGKLNKYDYDSLTLSKLLYFIIIFGITMENAFK